MNFANIKLEGKHAIILTGINSLEWKSSILADAHLIQANDILTKEETLLYTRIFQSLNATVRDSLGPLDDTHMAATIWKDLAQRHAISRAEERLQTTKRMRDLRLKNNDFHIYLFYEFPRMKLDEFYATKQGPIQNLDLDVLMDQLATRATFTITATEQSVNERPEERQCHYCEQIGHLIKYCWFKNPSLAGADSRERNKGRIEALRNKNKDKDDLAASQPSAQTFFTAATPDFEELLKCQPSYGY
ncbi:hypothetical protein ACJ73_03455 [Blastomyces percursus]|uniref:CCHC-type domain-containing protein n=1 Tax=Blastomyces percursus TaxID=1658174 RepID=A0A1J9QAU7_9EURO|nr:hypothetical protein ACJ73_03455 [Blastomyces percursus]